MTDIFLQKYKSLHFHFYCKTCLLFSFKSTMNHFNIYQSIISSENAINCKRPLSHPLLQDLSKRHSNAIRTHDSIFFFNTAQRTFFAGPSRPTGFLLVLKMHLFLVLNLQFVTSIAGKRCSQAYSGIPFFKGLGYLAEYLNDQVCSKRVVNL